MSGFLIIFQSWLFQYPWPELAAAFLLPYLYIAVQQLRHRCHNELFRLVTENAADMIALVEVSGKRLYHSPSYKKVLGY
jgi:PAS domain-containing protein